MKQTLFLIIFFFLLTVLNAQNNANLYQTWKGKIVLTQDNSDNKILEVSELQLEFKNKNGKEEGIFLSKNIFRSNFDIRYSFSDIEKFINDKDILQISFKHGLPYGNSNAFLDGKYFLSLHNDLQNFSEFLYGSFKPNNYSGQKQVTVILFPEKEYIAYTKDNSDFNKAAEIHNYFARIKQEEEQKDQEEKRKLEEEKRKQEEEKLQKQDEKWIKLANRLFAKTKTKLSLDQKVQIAKLLGWAEDPKSDNLFLADEKDWSKDDPFECFISPVDFNKDGKEEIFISYGNNYTSGNTGSSIVLLLPVGNGQYRINFDFPGLSPDTIKPATENIYPELIIGGPGFQFPIWKWNGKEYQFNRKISDSDFRKIRTKTENVLNLSSRYQETIP